MFGAQTPSCPSQLSATSRCWLLLQWHLQLTAMSVSGCEAPLRQSVERHRCTTLRRTGHGHAIESTNPKYKHPPCPLATVSKFKASDRDGRISSRPFLDAGLAKVLSAQRPPAISTAQRACQVIYRAILNRMAGNTSEHGDAVLTASILAARAGLRSLQSR